MNNHQMRMPRRTRPNGPPMAPRDIDSPGRGPSPAKMAVNPGSMAHNPDMMEQQMGIVGKPRIGSLKHLRQMMQGHAKRY